MSLEANIKLEDACLLGNLDTVMLLVSQGADVHAHNDASVCLASHYGHLNIVKYLVSKGANIHTNNDEALRFAAAYGHLDVVKYLASMGANVHANNNEALRLAARRYLDIVKYLVKYHNADIHVRYEAYIWDCKNIDIVAYLVSQGASIEGLQDYQQKNLSIYRKQHRRRETRAASKIYFWWIQKCYVMSSPSGIRMCLRNVAEYEAICAS